MFRSACVIKHSHKDVHSNVVLSACKSRSPMMCPTLLIFRLKFCVHFSSPSYVLRIKLSVNVRYRSLYTMMTEMTHSFEKLVSPYATKRRHSPTNHNWHSTAVMTTGGLLRALPLTVTFNGLHDRLSSQSTQWSKMNLRHYLREQYSTHYG
jgi:hypothetical protein